MTYQKLIAEHDAIEAAAFVVLTLANREAPRPADASKALEILAQLLRDHLAHEDVVIYQTLLSARDGKHSETAQMVSVELEQLKDDWESYLYRWDIEHVAASWESFSHETGEMLRRIRERVMFETMVLYSLALHFDVIAID